VRILRWRSTSLSRLRFLGGKLLSWGRGEFGGKGVPVLFLGPWGTPINPRESRKGGQATRFTNPGEREEPRAPKVRLMGPPLNRENGGVKNKKRGGPQKKVRGPKKGSWAPPIVGVSKTKRTAGD